MRCRDDQGRLGPTQQPQEPRARSGLGHSFTAGSGEGVELTTRLEGRHGEHVPSPGLDVPIWEMRGPIRQH